VRARPTAENKRANASFNQATGQRLGGAFFPTSDDARSNSQIGARVDGAFTGTTHDILRWAACKWGIDEDIVYAQAAKESWWRQTVKGDFGGDAAACPPGHGLGVDGQAGQCPQSYGILQNRYPYEQASWPGIANSTAMNADTAYAIWRVCFEGYEHWLNDVEKGGQYGAGDAWGCVGRWFAGRWHTAPANQYMAAVQDYQRQRIWEQGSFQEA
jgi:autotransporter family porin